MSSPELPDGLVPQPNEAPNIEVDPEVDSTYDVEETSLASLTSSVVDFPDENGRRYHSNKFGSKYWAPNDQRQQEAESLFHCICLGALDELNLAPVPTDLQLALDLGCGAGDWAMEFADEHPSAAVIGVDLSPIQPNLVPPNCSFQVDDINEEWTFSAPFDFIHIRALTGCVPDWASFYGKVVNHLKPGGWVEQVELSGIALSDDNTLPPDSALANWWKHFEDIGEKTGMKFTASEDAESFMEAAGLANLRTYECKVPIGPWAKDPKLKELGRWNRRYLTDGLEGFALRGFTDVLGWSEDEVQVYLAKLRNEINNQKIHSYLYLRVVCGQKPEGGSL